MAAMKEKILLLLLGGLAISYARYPGQQWKVAKAVSREWKKLNQRELHAEIRKLYRSNLVKKTKNPDGTYTFVLTAKGKLRALTYDFDHMKISRGVWDGKWRFLIFDIPEKLKHGRDALRNKIKELGFHELQKSVFVFPY